MKVLVTRSFRLMLLCAFGVTHGCANKNPDWLMAPVGAFCASGLTASCLKDMAERSYADATAQQVRAKGAEPASSRAEATRNKILDRSHPSDTTVHYPASQIDVKKDVVVEPPTSIKPESPGGSGTVAAREEGDTESTEEKSETNKVPTRHQVTGTAATPKTVPANATPSKVDKPPSDDISLRGLAFGLAAIGAKATEADGYHPSVSLVGWKEGGALLNIGNGPMTDEHLLQAGKIEDKVTRASVLSGMLSLYSRSMSETQVNGVLNELYSLDKGQYANALIVKLPGLLKTGDLERAKALRAELLSSAPTAERSFSMLAFVATCYTMAGLEQDAGDIVREALQDGEELTADDQRLIRLSVSVANGTYPMMQDFYDFESDKARLNAYLTIGVIARQLDQPDVAFHAIADAVKFIQKAAVTLDKQKALGQILAISPGII